MVEFVIVLPFMFALLFLIVYAAVGFDRYLRVTDAARIGARAGAVARFDGTQPCLAAQAAATNAAGGLAIDFPTCIVSAGGDLTFEVRNNLDLQLPILDWFVGSPSIALTSTVTEHVE